MLTVLINAYACAPNRGSEPGMAWNWIINLANHCKLHVITEGEWRSDIEQALKTLPQAANITFYFNPVSPEIRKMCWNQGDWRFYYFYRKWQKATYRIAREIIKKHSIDIVHQLNMIGFREPGYLWQITEKPFIWGPINAKEAFPVAFLQGASIKSKSFINIKNTLNKLQLKFLTRVKQAVINSHCIIAASSDSADAIKKYFNVKPVLLNESGCSLPGNNKTERDFAPKPFKILWVGRFIFTKQLNLALQTLNLLRDLDIQLHIVGGERDEEVFWQKKAEDLNIDDKIVWHGKIPHFQVQELMQQSHLLFFTSVAEGTPHVVLEAIANQLPVLCFDTCGQGDCVNDLVGVKVRLSNPKKSIVDFAEKITFLYNNPVILANMSVHCRQRQLELSWENKARQLVEIYNSYNC